MTHGWRPSRCRGEYESSRQNLRLPVAPDVLHSAPAVQGVMRDEVLHGGAVREIVEPPGDRGTDGRFLELLLNLLDERQTFRRVELLRLLLDQQRDLLVAVPRVVGHRPAAVVLEE